jgi:polar amino acid transport system substrate-binding protein
MTTLPRHFGLRMPFWAGVAGVVLGGAVAGQPLTLKRVMVCDDANDWPPFTYQVKSPSKQTGSAVGPNAASGSQEVQGFSVEVLRRLLAPHGIALQIELLPWVRCLREVESGVSFQMALNVSANAERRLKFHFSQPYHATTPGYFYSRRRFPQGLPIRRMEDLAAFRVCGVHGYNYSAYGLTNEQVDRGALSFDRVVAKLLADRCEVGIGELEVVRASQFIGKPLAADADLAYDRVPGMAKVEFHMLVSRQHAQGKALVNLIDQGLSSLQRSGELQAIYKRYTN